MALPLLTINGVSIQMPSTHGWSAPGSLGVGGAGNDVIPGVWSYGLAWNFMAPAEFNEIWDIWNDNQGQDITAELPEIGTATYALKSYTCRINPVTFQGFFEGHYQGVRTELVGIDITA